MRVLIEVLHILAGIFAAMLIASIAAWSYPLAKHDIWWVAYAAMVAVAVFVPNGCTPPRLFIQIITSVPSGWPVVVGVELNHRS